MCNAEQADIANQLVSNETHKSEQIRDDFESNNFYQLKTSYLTFYIKFLDKILRDCSKKIARSMV